MKKKGMIEPERGWIIDPKTAEKGWIVDSKRSVPPRHQQFFRKTIERDAIGRVMVWRENPPLGYADLNNKDLLDTGDLMRYFHLSRPTLARYMKLGGLKPYRKIGREWFFKKGEVEKWRRGLRRKEKKWPLKISPKS